MASESLSADEDVLFGIIVTLCKDRCLYHP
jgi:hypothetical protein